MPQYRIRTKHGKPFRRNGVVFTPEWFTADVSGWTEEQLREFHNAVAAGVLMYEEVPEAMPEPEPTEELVEVFAPRRGRPRRGV